MSIGWVKIHRKMQEWEWYHNSECVHLFLHCLIKANRKEKSWRGFTIKRGQFGTSLKTLSAETGLSFQILRNKLNKLQSTNNIKVESTNKFTLITIIKYSDYQEKKKSPTNKQQTTQQTNNKQNESEATTTKEDKKQEAKNKELDLFNEKPKEPKNAKIKRDFKPGCTLIEFYKREAIEGLPGNWSQWCVDEHGWSAEQINAVAKRFWNYWTSDDCRAPKKRNWYQTWQQWCGRERVPRTFSNQIGGISDDEKMLKSAERIDILTDFLMEKTPR